MNCLDFRRALGADPNRNEDEIVAHSRDCATCAKYAQEMQRLDGLIKRALEVPVPQGERFVAPTPRRWYAMAASLLMTVAVGAIVWVGLAPRESIAADVVDHIAHEARAMTITDTRVANETLEKQLAEKGLKLAAPLDGVSYLQNCWIRRAWAPHLVVQTGSGPVAVIVLPDEQVWRSQRFEEDGYNGEVVPVGKGAIVVVANDAEVIDQVTEKVRQSIVWP